MATTKKPHWFSEIWIIPVGLLLAAAYSAYRGLRSAHSGSTIPGPNGGIIESTQNVHFYETAGGLFFFGFLLAAIGTFYFMWREK